MPLSSMTGFGRGQVREGAVSVDCDIRGVNNRFLDLQIRLPRTHAALEPRIREKLSQRLSRGRVDIGFSIDAPASEAFKVKVDIELAGEYLAKINALQKKLHLDDGISVEDIIELDGVLRTVETSEDLGRAHWPIVEKALNKATTAFLSSRKREGQTLLKEVRRLLDEFKPVAAQMAAEVPVAMAALREKFSDRIRSVAGTPGLDANRLNQEAAILMTKSDVTEEIARLQAHVKELESAIKAGSPVGKRLDFILQEINREITTYGNKVQSLSISRLVVEAKSTAEKIREQIQNVE